MPRSSRAYLSDILVAIGNISEYTKGMEREDFEKNRLVQDATVRNLEIIGEAAKNIPDDIRDQAREVEWKKIAGLRDLLAHAYFGIDIEIVWDIVTNKLSPLKESIEELLE